MNVMGYKQENAQALISLLSMLSIGTKVTIEVVGHDKVSFGRIYTPNDVLNLCERCHASYGHALKVHEIGIVPDYDGSRLLLKCH